MNLRYVSTHRGTPPTRLSDALAAGLAPDGGLFVPASLPQLAMCDFDGATTLPQIAARLLRPFFEGDSLAPHLEQICAEAFNFNAPLIPLSVAQTLRGEPVEPRSTMPARTVRGEPVEPHSTTPARTVRGEPVEPHSTTHVLELFHGPTAAFKDYGARFLAACLRRLHQAGTPLTIVVATSGDTGAAVAAAFHGLPGLRVVILYPEGRVSPRQAHQLGAFGDNVRALRVAGSFDDCQALAKRAINDTALQGDVPLSSANSISLGRLLPQMAYYANAAIAFQREHGEVLNFVVPTGNLGNALAAVFARACGVPIGRIALATNANRTLPDFFAGGDYAARASVPTLANAMDVGAPSNFERLRWLFPDDDALRREFSVTRVDDATIRATIARAWERHGVAICPHTATALHARESLGEGRWAVVATAHPAKFETLVEPLLGTRIAPPLALAALLAKPSHADAMANDYAALESVLRSGV